MKDGSKSYSKTEGRLQASSAKLQPTSLQDLQTRLLCGSNGGNPAQRNRVNIHVPEESSAEIAFVPKQAEDHQFVGILKDDSPASSARKQNIFSNPETAAMTTQKVIKVCQRWKILYLFIPFPCYWPPWQNCALHFSRQKLLDSIR